MKNWMLMLVMLFTTVSALSQTQITGTVMDGDMQFALPGATVVVKGTTNGTSSDMDGKFSLSVSEKTGHLEVSFIGYKTKTISFNATEKSINLGKIVLNADENLLDDIVIMGVADVAKDRKTPVAVSTIKAAEIQEKLGAQEFPEILNTTPSVYASKGGGGFGDSKINIRGFDQKNIAVMINGMPVNDMEGGSVYWSNWSGLADVTSAMQVQRGLGSSKIAISSVGGTINVLTRTADARQGGSVATSVGSADYFKALASYSTGVLENGLSASILLGHTFGDGYVDGTKFEGSNYFVGLGYRSKDARHNLQLTFTGATQWHNQRSYANPIRDYLKYGTDGDPNIKYNSEWGYLDGEEFSWKRNFYHKPVASLNWDFKINETFNLSTVFYGSWGRGGGTGVLGNLNGKRDFDPTFKDENGQIRFDDIVAWNSGEHVADFGADRNTTNGENINDDRYGFVRRASNNSHDWYGAVVNLNTKLTDNLTFDLGVDARTYTGYHFQNITDMMGADGYLDKANRNTGNRYIYESYEAKASYNPFASMGNREKVGYDNDGNVKWIGGFGQLEYSGERLSAFVQGSVSNQSFRRIDYFSYNRENPRPNDPNYKTDWKDIVGGNVKGGANYNLDDYNNVFVNAGYYSRQPYMNGGVFINNSNVMNPDLKNEKIFGLELGYGLRTRMLNANVNLYRTSWSDRIIRTTDKFPDPADASKEIRGYANLYGVEQIHMGVEVDFLFRPTDNLSFMGSFSYGDWRYNSDVTATFMDENSNTPIVDPSTGQVREQTLYLKDVKVGDAPQMVFNIGAAYEVAKGLKVDANYRYSDNFYPYIDAATFKNEDHQGSIKLPSFSLFDAGVSYRMEVGREKQNAVSMRLNVNNVLDKIFISEGRTNIHKASEAEYNASVDKNGKDVGIKKDFASYDSYLENGLYKGIDTRNQVFFGAGRTWNFTLRFEF